MSWKSLVSAGLLCVVASPVWAAPALTISGGRLTKGGTPVRVWNVAVTPDFTATGSNGAATALALELGFEATGGNILTINSTQNATRVLDQNPGNLIFGGETLTAAANNKPVGLQAGSSWTTPVATKAFGSIGTAVFTNTGTAAQQRADLITITTDAAVTALKWGGAYTSGTGAYVTPTGTMSGVARIAQGTSATTATNFHDAAYTGTLLTTAASPKFLADMNGDGAVNFGDLAGFGNALTNVPAYTTASPNLNRVGRGDINGDGALNFGDLAGFGQILGGNNPGSGSAVPEPASAALIGLSVLGGLGLRRRR